MKVKILLTSLLVGCALFFGTAAIASADDPSDRHDNWHDDWDDDDDDDDDRDRRGHQQTACWWGGYWDQHSHHDDDFHGCPQVIIVFYYVPYGSFYPQVAAGAPFYMHAGQPMYGGFPGGYPWPGMGY